jgi:hypothetical protein
LSQSKLIGGFFFSESCTREVLPRYKWPLHVGLLGTNLSLSNITDSKATTFPAGSSSRLLTLSGVLSKDVETTGGRSGSVVTAPPSLLGTSGFFADGELIFALHRFTLFCVGQPSRL